jgi:hypothetical protein
MLLLCFLSGSANPRKSLIIKGIGQTGFEPTFFHHHRLPPPSDTSSAAAPLKSFRLLAVAGSSPLSVAFQPRRFASLPRPERSSFGQARIIECVKLAVSRIFRIVAADYDAELPVRRTTSPFYHSRPCRSGSMGRMPQMRSRDSSFSTSCGVIG